MSPIRTDERYSAICVFRWHRKILGWRKSYWLAVHRHGRPEQRPQAAQKLAQLSGMNPLGSFILL